SETAKGAQGKGGGVDATVVVAAGGSEEPSPGPARTQRTGARTASTTAVIHRSRLRELRPITEAVWGDSSGIGVLRGGGSTERLQRRRDPSGSIDQAAGDDLRMDGTDARVHRPYPVVDHRLCSPSGGEVSTSAPGRR